LTATTAATQHPIQQQNLLLQLPPPPLRHGSSMTDLLGSATVSNFAMDGSSGSTRESLPMSDAGGPSTIEQLLLQQLGGMGGQHLLGSSPSTLFVAEHERQLPVDKGF
jgi:hypothetical protein